MDDKFLDLGLHPQLVQTVADLGYTEPTPIQSGVIPLMLEGRDVLGLAQTGTGKTAAFALPILQTISPRAGYVQALILAPTRELAMQVAKATHEYGSSLDMSVLAIYGGQPYDRQMRRLRKGVDVVVGTPGRLLDLIKRKALDLSQTKIVVLDEADEMLSMGFVEDIELILSETSSERQTALFSATLPKGIRRLASNYMHDPEAVTVKRKQLTVDSIEQRYYVMHEGDKLNALTRFFEVEEITSALIFARTRVGTGELANEMTQRGFQAEPINGDLSQNAREMVLNRFRWGQIQVLVATDVAARGLDIDDISHVFNFDLPRDPEVFVHRVGRTGRAGKKGIAISLVSPRDMFRLRKIEKYARVKITKCELPTIEEIQKFREAKLEENMMVWLRRGRCTRERALVDRLVSEGHDALEVAAAALKLARSEEKQRPIPQIKKAFEGRQRDGRGGYGGRNDRSRRSGGGNRNGGGNGRYNGGGNGRSSGGGNNRSRSNGPANKRSHEKGMVRLALGAGHTQGVRPNDVVGTIAFHADIPGRSIGAIRIQEDKTFVDIPEQFVSQVLEKSGDIQIHRENVTITRVK